MERKRILVAVIATAVLSFFFAESAAAQAPGGRGHRGRFFRNAREHWRQMSPEDRQRFRSNAERWMRLPPEEQRALRNREILRRQRIRRDADAALQQSGLQLESGKRELYERRYFQERQRIDRNLRQEIQERRQRELAPVMEDLKKEFGDPAKAPNTSATVAPNK